MRPALAALVLLAACNDFPTPAELDHAEILALRADPPAIPAGGRARLSALVGDAQGEASGLAASWAVVGVVAGAPALGGIEVDESGAVWYVAPAATPGGKPALAVVQVAIDHPERTLTGIKGVGVGIEPTANPEVAALSVDGEALGDDGVMRLSVGGRAALAVEVAPPPGDTATYAWYATVGVIDPYRQPVTEIAAPDQAGDGWLVVVVRDGVGGVAWRSARVSVE